MWALQNDSQHIANSSGDMVVDSNNRIPPDGARLRNLCFDSSAVQPAAE